jgi:hypothetical protein
MQRRRLEALAEAVQHVTEYKIPGSPLYLARNPGGLKAYNGKPADEHGSRVFGSVIDGLQALLFDTALKLEGMSKHCLQPSDTLQEFAIAHGQPATAAEAYAKFLRRALQQDGINKKLTLSFFLEE